MATETKKQIYQGENGIILWPLLQSDGSPLPIIDLTLLYVEVIQNYRVKKRYTYLDGELTPDPELRICEDDQDGEVDVSAGNVLEFEYTSELTESLSKQPTYLKVNLKAVNSKLLVDEEQRDEFQIFIFEVI